MKITFLIGMLLLCLSLISLAGRIEKKKTILNSKCNPFGSKCSATNNSLANITYVYNEPRQQSFSIQFTEQEVLQNEELKKVLLGKTNLILEEVMPIPEEVIRELQMPQNYKVAQGKYEIRYANRNYSIIFKE